MTQRMPNHQLKALIEESGLPYDGVARAVKAVALESGQRLGTNKSAVHHWVQGAEPSGATPGYLAEALSRRLGRRITREDLGLGSRSEGEDESIGLTLDFDPIETLTALGEADVNRRRFLAASAYSMAAATLPLEMVQEAAARTRTVSGGAVAGHADVAAVRDMVKLFMDMDERHGGQHGRTAFVQYLVTDVAELCRGRFASEQVRAEALSVASAGAHLAGWKAYDSGEQGLAQRYYLQSLALARASGVPGQDGFVMRTMSQQGMKLHRPEHCLALAATGWDRAKGRVDAQVEALFAVTHAHALAKTGQRRAAVADIEHARTALAAGVRSGDEVPFWALVWGPPAATVHSRTAKVFETLGDRPNAARQYATAAASRPGTTYARIIALDLVAQAEQQAKQGSIEQACVTWGRAIDTMAGVKSTRTLKAVRSLRSDLRPYRARGVRVAAELDERARIFLTHHR
ncbi:hypothetical protein AQI88_41915 [Streptomyces cellostaticus]|uniref:Tat pathway signal protein n=1 Tax=Streptomyces cellostaticus TaxID=67285 RepID=A0A117PPG1_9ACTN|nr:hypothetical protein [Streptomyces cellostaticus]KUM84322.1 hypothetical protein AQI88_41915 [Streptomyces cellostaticus]GHI10320.1 Tat pathway signal protein [Streptomyces cellostaticus]